MKGVMAGVWEWVRAWWEIPIWRTKFFGKEKLGGVYLIQVVQEWGPLTWGWRMRYLEDETDSLDMLMEKHCGRYGLRDWEHV